jgi:enterochelin esterase-like enzyme
VSTRHTKSDQARTLIGDSLGGTVSLMTALDYPNMFGNVIMQSLMSTAMFSIK